VTPLFYAAAGEAGYRRVLSGPDPRYPANDHTYDNRYDNCCGDTDNDVSHGFVDGTVIVIIIIIIIC